MFPVGFPSRVSLHHAKVRDCSVKEHPTEPSSPTITSVREIHVPEEQLACFLSLSHATSSGMTQAGGNLSVGIGSSAGVRMQQV